MAQKVAKNEPPRSKLPVVTGRATVGMLNVVGVQLVPARVTAVGLNTGVVAVTIEGEVVWDGVMVPLYPYVRFVGQKLTWTSAVSPALIEGVEVEALILKSTTFAVCDLDPCTGPPFALALPETVIEGAVPVIAGVTSTSTAAPVVQVPVHTARF